MRLLRHSQALVATLTAALVLGAAAPGQPSAGEYGCAYPAAGAGPHRSRHRGAGHPWGGISGIDYDAQSGQFWLISDDRSAHACAHLHARWSPAQQPTQPPTSRASSRCSFAGTRAASACGGRAGRLARGGIPRCAKHCPPGNGRVIFPCHRPLPPHCSPSAPARAPQRASLEGLAFLTTAAPPGWRWKWPGCRMAPAPPMQTAGGPVRITTGRGHGPGTAAAGLHPGRRSPRPPTAGS